MKSLLLSTALILFSLSCNKSEKVSIDENLFYSFTKGRLQGLKAVLIIPESGCSGCTSKAEKFVQQALENETKEVLFIFTGIIDRKLLINRLGLSRNNLPTSIIFDTKRALLSIQQQRIYPLVIFLKDEKIIDLVYKTPTNKTIFNRLNNLLLED